MKTVCELNRCAGCMACVNKCSLKAIDVIDDIKHFNAIIDENKCVKCGACEKVCPQLNTPKKNNPLQWYQGWAKSSEIRKNSSSGGAAACITKAFIEDGGYVCSCLFNNGEFNFKIIHTLEEAKSFAGSKYVKSNPSGIHEKIRVLLNENKKVLFIGLPCQVAGLNNYLQNTDKSNLYTVDLICHGTPSRKVLDMFLKQNGVEMEKLKDISFRSNEGMGISSREKCVSMPGTVDAYLLSFLNALIYTDNCYSCKFATTDRISDITLGDSWGTSLRDEMRKGVSLILVNTEKGGTLISEADIDLHDVDIDRAIAANAQLREPSYAPTKREWFMNQLEEGKNYNSLVRKALPKQYTRQVIKGWAIKLHLKKSGGGIG